MLSFTVIGSGACGNKAVIDLMSDGYNNKKCFLINSTARDIPAEYHDKIILFGQSQNRLGGCGKERSIGKDMILEDMRTGSINLDQMVSDEDQAIVLVGSTEGGSGSASIPVMASYFKNVHGKNVIIVLFFGFEDDTRGIRNSIELCQELSEDYTVIGISNKSFMTPDGTTTKFFAEQNANKLFCDMMKILSGAIIRPGSQVMDDTDLYKVVTTPGYMMGGTFAMPRPKTPDEYKRYMMNVLRTQHFVDPGKEPGAKRIAMVFDVPEADPNVDFQGQVFKDMYGEPFELFTNLSENDDGIYMVSYIASGMRMPSEEIENLYNEFLNRNQKVNQSRDSFFDKIGQLDAGGGTQGFDMLKDTSAKPVGAAKADFFAAFQKKAQQIQAQAPKPAPKPDFDKPMSGGIVNPNSGEY